MAKDVLEYTKEELEAMSINELNVLFREAETKESLYDTRQLSEKLAINSLYGALGNRWFPLFNQDIARSITGNGRYFIKMMSNYIENRLQELNPRETPYGIYNDTDSFYFTIDDFVARSGLTDLTEQTNFADKFYKEVIDAAVQQCIADYAKELNVYNPSVIGAEREIIADKGVFVAKKKYFARVLDSEGVRYTKPKTKVMGLELIKSSTPKFSKENLQESLEIIFDSEKSNMQDWIEGVKDKFIKAPLGEIASVGGVSNLNFRLGDKGIPIGARSAMVHNHYIDSNQLQDQFTKIQGGDKTKRLYLNEPNPLNSNIVAFLDDRFIEMFKDYIDYETNFEKGFLKPLELMTNALNWDLRHQVDELDDW